MDLHHASNSNVATPLFPAYSSSVQHDKDNKDWLCNSSFTESAFQQVSQILNEQKKETLPVEVSCVPFEPEVIAYKHIEKKKKSHKKKYEKYKDSSEFAVPESESILKQLKKKTFIEETGLSFERAFCIDSSRDTENLMFENFERTKIANYHIRVEFPIGLSLEELSLWSLNLPKKKSKVSERYFSKSFLKSSQNTTFEEIFSSKEPLKLECLEYLPVLITQNNDFRTIQSEYSPNFLNVSSSWKTESIDKEKPSNDFSTDNMLADSTKDKVIFYNKKLSENPTDVNMWLEFLDFQDKIDVMSDECKQKDVNYQNIVHEKKVAILEKALKYNPKDLKLNIMKLKFCHSIYATDKLICMWEKLISENAKSPDVWQNYLRFIISNLETFNVSSILNLYMKCLQIISSLCEDTSSLQMPDPSIVSNILGIFHQLCIILKSCGYIEKGIALYQAMIEFNLFCDQKMKTISTKERIACFEPFWDSGAPRIGEKNALGWASTVQQKKLSFDYISTDSDLNNKEDDILYQKLSVSETWLEFERLREFHHWFPWKPNPEYDQTSDDIDDLERIVSFDDVSKFLFFVDGEENLFMLVLDFLTFLGFDAHLFGCHYNKRTYCHISIDHYQNMARKLITSKLINSKKNPLWLETNSWNEEKFSFVNNVFSQLCSIFSQKYKTLLTYIWLKFRKFYGLEIKEENKEDIKSLKKFAKGVLRIPENRNCLLHWLEYIHIEWLVDPQVAFKTFRTLLLSSISASSSGNMPIEELLYFIQYILDLTMALTSHHSSTLISSKEIQWILFHMSDRENYTPYLNQEITSTMILKTLAVFKSLLDKELDKLLSIESDLCYCIDPYFYSLINCSKCFAYFQYFSKNIDAAIEVYKSTISFIDLNISSHCGQYIKEELCVAQAELLNYHTWNSSASIRPLQAALNGFIENYPCNSKLLWMLVKMKNAASVICPTRRFLVQILRNIDKSHPVTWLFALAAEFAISYSLLLQSDYIQGNSVDNYMSTLGINWRIRSLYEKMLKSDLCVHVPLLWRSYLKFEVLMQNMRKAESVFHRALQNCGWSKELLMDGITYFPDQLKQILGLMTEKQIRIHTPLEEVILLLEHGVDNA